MQVDTNVPKNKLVLLLLGLFLFLLIFSLLPDNWFKSKKSYSKEKEEDSLTLLNQKLSKDYLNAPSDTEKADSVPNWKKALLDSVDPSTINATQTKEQIEKQKDLDDPNNLTSQVAKNSYAISTYIAQQGGTIDQNTLDDISKNIVNNSLAQATTKNKTHLASEFKTTTKNDKATLKKYGDDLAKNLYTVFLAGNKDDLDILSSYLTTEDASILRKYDPAITAFTKLRENLLKMTVPEIMLPLHVREINIAEAYLNNLIVFSRTNHDPLRSVVTIEEYRKNLLEFYSIIKDYNILFIENNISYTTSENGYMFFNEKMANMKTN